MKNPFSLLILLALSAAATAAPNLIKNGDFETDRYPVGTPVQLTPDETFLTGWTIISEAAGIGNNYNGNPTQEIDLSGFYDGAGQGISQSFATTNGTKYSLGLDVYGGGVNVLVNGASLATGLSGGARTPYAFSFTATGASTTLSLISGGGSVVQVDNVNVQAVPEPASLAALGLGAVALLRRRRKA